MRNLSIIGRSILINTFVYSKVYFYATGSPISPQFISHINTLSQKFIWGTQHPPIKIQRCYGKKQSGGIGLIDVLSHTQKLFSKTLIKVMQADNSQLSWANTYRINMARAIG